MQMCRGRKAADIRTSDEPTARRVEDIADSPATLFADRGRNRRDERCGVDCSCDFLKLMFSDGILPPQIFLLPLQNRKVVSTPLCRRGKLAKDISLPEWYT